MTTTGIYATTIKGMLSASSHDQLSRCVSSKSTQLALLRDDIYPDEGLYTNRFNRAYLHNPPYLVQIHNQLTELMVNIVGEELKPSYAFLSIYGSQGICPLHVDRQQCRWTLDYLIADDLLSSWPIYISRPLTEHERRRDACTVVSEQHAHQIISRYDWTEVNLEPNDAVVYSGTHQWHYRNRISGNSATLAFFHFVPISFQGSLG